jgi:hypothetical protein
VVIHPNGTEVLETDPQQSPTQTSALTKKADTKILVHGFGSSGKDAFAIQTKNGWFPTSQCLALTFLVK